MSQPVFSSFDPLATHPFTNNSGLMPKPTPPSQVPHPIPSPLRALSGGSSLTPGQIPSLPAHSMHAPQPKRAPSGSKASSGAPRPIFVPFRPERSSPELDDILLKKKVSDVFANKSTWSIDQTRVPMPSTVPSSITAGNGRGGKAQ
ncbi:hypothetical protein AcV5_005730 [Taiwanofungus camphoratus]|nr:hypothetical protein AcW2_004176 [Antrodia cinnamomea]KAI0933633.1 hypothetical protein AcV5_005730 [Antrodia cinnamomea]KAI0948574.1 hypothetical protein AcV7_009278 [Antrodia cinnamomea]